MIKSGTQYAAAATSKASSCFMLVSMKATPLARSHLFVLDSAQSAVQVFLVVPGTSCSLLNI